MSVNSINGFVAYDIQKMGMIGPNGHLDPKKCKKQPNCVWTKPLTPEEKEKIMEYMKDPKKHFKPGLIDPMAEEKAEKAKKTLLTLGGAAVAAVLAFVFRGKISSAAKKAITAAAPYVKKAVEFVKNTKVFDTVKKATSGIVQKAKAYAPKVVENLKNGYTKYAKPLVNKVLAFFENIKPTVAKK